MSQFPSAQHLSSWAGICPGNNRSAGKSKSSKIKKGNKFLLAALVEAGWAARTKESTFPRKFHRWMGKLRKAKANVAIAHSLLELIYAILQDHRPYREPEPGVIHAMEKAKLVRHHAKRPRQLGADETLVQETIARMNQADACSGIAAAEGNPQDVPGKGLPGCAWISGSPGPEAGIFSCHRSSGRKSFVGTAYNKTQKNIGEEYSATAAIAVGKEHFRGKRRGVNPKSETESSVTAFPEG